MSDIRPVLTVGYLRQWLDENKIDDDAVLSDASGRPLRDLSASTCWAGGEDHPAVRLTPHWG